MSVTLGMMGTVDSYCQYEILANECIMLAPAHSSRHSGVESIYYRIDPCEIRIDHTSCI